MKILKREKYLSRFRAFFNEPSIIKVLTGVRRCGKSTLMETIAEELHEKGAAKENIVFINLDKRGYRSIRNADQLDSSIERSLPNNGQMVYLFIDEIQNVKGFEEVINGYREEGNVSIFITGSNSYLLSGELMTKLTGRYIEVEVFPFDFDEFEQAKKLNGLEIGESDDEFNYYISHGGFPGALLFEEEDARVEYLHSLVKEIFDKDIKPRVKIRHLDLFERVRDFILGNHGSTMSVKSIADYFREKEGVSISRITIKRYIDVLVASKIVYRCQRFDMKSRKALSGEEKYYLADASFHFMLSTDSRINFGPELENLIYIHHLSLGNFVSVGKIGNLECDFIVRNKKNDYRFLQVAYTIYGGEAIGHKKKTLEDREYEPLEKIKDSSPKYVLTMDRLIQKRGGVIHQNIVKYLVSDHGF